MGDYSFVNDDRGDICGLWLRDSNLTTSKNTISMLLIKHGADNLVESALSGNFRIVPNSYDEQGGVFVMFGSAPAPGENFSRSGDARDDSKPRRNNRYENTSTDDSMKQCAVCGEIVDQHLLQCPSCGKGTFESQKTHWHHHESARESKVDPGSEDIEANENIFSRIFNWFKNTKHRKQTKTTFFGSLDDIAAIAGEGACPLCGKQMEKDQLGLRCENGHDVVCRNAFFSEYTTPSEGVARALRDKGVKVVVLP